MTRAPIPQRLVGIWRREAIVLHDHPAFDDAPFETSDVLWFQGPSHYVDLRLARLPDAAAEALGGLEAFGGPNRLTGATLRFAHEIDLGGGIEDDVGEIEFDGDRLLERGRATVRGVRFAFTEHWRRFGAGDEARELTRRDAAGVSGFAIRIGSEELRIVREPGGAVGVLHRELSGTPRTCMSIGAVDGALHGDWIPVPTGTA